MGLTKCLLLMPAAWIVLAATPAAAQAGQFENTPQACQDGIDNDLDGYIDCADQDCESLIFCSQEAPGTVPPPAPVPSAVPENTVELCSDFQDNDLDGLADCNDPGCKIFAVCVAPAPAPALEPPPPVSSREPRESKGGIGIYASVVVFGRASAEWDVKGTPLDEKEEYKMNVNGGFGIFGEYLPKPFVAIGGEIYLAFPKVNEFRSYDAEWEEWDEWDDCGDYCETSVFFNLLFRLRFIIPAGKWVGIYPIIGFGMGNYTSRTQEDDADQFFGLVYSAGLGLEGHTPTIITPFFEFRYYGGVGWWVNMTDYEEEYINWEKILYNSLSLNFGVRFL